MSGRTPGPWSAWEWSVTGPTAAAAMTAEQSLKGEFGVPNTRVCQAKTTGNKAVALAFGETQDEADENARLIAAAPDLLDALKDALCVLEACVYEFDYVTGKVRAAIAKAEDQS